MSVWMINAFRNNEYMKYINYISARLLILWTDIWTLCINNNLKTPSCDRDSASHDLDKTLKVITVIYAQDYPKFEYITHNFEKCSCLTTSALNSGFLFKYTV